MILLLQSSVATGNLPPVATDTTAVLTASAVSVWIIQQLKSATWFKVLTPSTATLNRLASIIAAAATATGIHVAFSAGTLTITGLTLTGIIAAVIAWFKSFVMNELIYQGIANRAEATPVNGGQPAKRL
jgi:hypothetical protein